jgi:hypothetical protein
MADETNETKFTGFADADEIRKREKDRRLWLAYCKDLDEAPLAYLKEFLEVRQMGFGWNVILHQATGGDRVILTAELTQMAAEKWMNEFVTVIAAHLHQFTKEFLKAKVE